MDEFLKSPAWTRLVQKIHPNLMDIYCKSFYLVFLCGGDGKQEHHLRHKFYKYFEKEKKDSHITLINVEDVYDSFHIDSDGSRINLVHFEEDLGLLSDLILVFPESAGSYAETGLFSSKEELFKKTLIVNNRSYNESESFILNGPIKHIRKNTSFEGDLNIIDDKEFKLITDRLSKTFTVSKKHSSIKAKFTAKNKKSKEQLLIILKSCAKFP